MRSRSLVPVFALALIGAIAACDNNITNIGEGLNDTATWVADLNGANERPNPVTTPATGRAWITDNGTTLTYHIEWRDLTVAANAAHIHRGDVNTAGPVIVPLTLVAQRGGVTEGTVDMSAADVGTDAGVMSPDSLRTLLNNGNAYVNIHTPGPNAGGEIRGQVRRR